MGHPVELPYMGTRALHKESVEKNQGMNKLVPFGRLRAHRCCKYRGFSVTHRDEAAMSRSNDTS
jgi:hypothetical protein